MDSLEVLLYEHKPPSRLQEEAPNLCLKEKSRQAHYPTTRVLTLASSSKNRAPIGGSNKRHPQKLPTKKWFRWRAVFSQDSASVHQICCVMAKSSSPPSRNLSLSPRYPRGKIPPHILLSLLPLPTIRRFLNRRVTHLDPITCSDGLGREDGLTEFVRQII